MIDSVKYYLGGSVWNDTTHYGTASDMYTWERGTTVYSGRSTNWTGRIGLMYPSDYVYTYALGVDNTCYTDGSMCYDESGNPSYGWIYNTNSNSLQWTMAPNSDYGNSALIVYSDGCVGGNFVGDSRGVRPSLYLKSNIQIESGDGSVGSPYVFKA